MYILSLHCIALLFSSLDYTKLTLTTMHQNYLQCTTYLPLLYHTPHPLHHATLHCNTLYYATLHYTTLYSWTFLNCTLLYCTILVCTALQCRSLHCRWPTVTLLEWEWTVWVLSWATHRAAMSTGPSLQGIGWGDSLTVLEMNNMIVWQSDSQTVW